MPRLFSLVFAALPTLAAAQANTPPGPAWPDAAPVARWDVVPLRVVDEPFEAGVVAHHPDGIASVAIDAPGEANDATVTTPSLNPRTGVVEFWTTLDPATLPADGNYTVTATVTSTVGTTRTLDLTLNGRDTVQPVVELPAGTHRLADLPRVDDRWVVVRPAHGADPAEVRVVTRFPSRSPVKLERVNLIDIDGGLGVPMLWLDRVLYTDGGGGGIKWSGVGTIHWTDSTVHDVSSAMLGGGGVTRNVTATAIHGDAIERPALVLNTTVQLDRFAGADGRAKHPDAVSTWRGGNVILQGLAVEDSPTAQAITVSPNGSDVLEGVALIDCTVRNSGASYLSAHRGTLRHVLVQGCVFERATWQIRSTENPPLGVVLIDTRMPTFGNRIVQVRERRDEPSPLAPDNAPAADTPGAESPTPASDSHHAGGDSPRPAAPVSRYAVGPAYTGPGPASNAHRGLLAIDAADALTAEPGGTVLPYTGAGGVIERAAIWGKARPNDPDEIRAAIGLHVYRPDGSRGIGTGKLAVRDTMIDGPRVGIQFANTLTDANADHTLLENVYFRDCPDAAMRVLNRMGMGFTVRHVHLVNCPVGFEFRAGGDLWLDGATVVSPTTFLLIDGPPHAISRNNGFFSLRNVKLDHQAAGSTIVRHAQPSIAHITLDGVHASQGRLVRQSPIRWLDLADGATVTVRDSFGLRANAIRWADTDHPYGITVLLDACRLGTSDPLTLFDTAGSTGTLHVTVRDCTDDAGRPVADFRGVLFGGAP